MAAKKSSTPKVMDVAKPGKSAPSTTSRPVIVGHRPMVQDPMVNDKTKAEDTEKKKEKPLTVHAPKIIKPLDASEVSEEAPKKPEVEAPPEPTMSLPEEAKPPEEPKPQTPEKSNTSDSETPEAKSETPPAPEEKSAEGEEPRPSEDANKDGVVDAIAEQAASKKQKTTEDVEAAKRQEALKKLIEEKKYLVPIGQVTHRRRTHWTIAVLILILLVGASAAAIDAGVVDPGFDVPFDLIKN